MKHKNLKFLLELFFDNLNYKAKQRLFSIIGLFIDLMSYLSRIK